MLSNATIGARWARTASGSSSSRRRGCGSRGCRSPGRTLCSAQGLRRGPSRRCTGARCGTTTSRYASMCLEHTRAVLVKNSSRIVCATPVWKAHGRACTRRCGAGESARGVGEADRLPCAHVAGPRDEVGLTGAGGLDARKAERRPERQPGPRARRPQLSDRAAAGDRAGAARQVHGSEEAWGDARRIPCESQPAPQTDGAAYAHAPLLPAA